MEGRPYRPDKQGQMSRYFRLGEMYDDNDNQGGNNRQSETLCPRPAGKAAKGAAMLS